MTEEIIIDGVDVAECEFIADTKNGLVKCISWVHNNKNPVSGHWDCRENKNCYYKQLQRLKQELQRYKDMEAKGLEEFKDIGGCWGCGLQLQLNQDIIDIKQLEQENERLKKELDFAYIKDPITKKECTTLYGKPIQYWIEKKEALDGANELIKGYHLRIKKLKSALEEIRTMATKNVSIESFVKIQNKINEVLK